QVIAAHARLARDTGGDDHDVGVGGVGIIVGADDVRVAFLDRHGFEQVETFALWDTFDDVDENDIGQFLRGDSVRCGSAHVPRPYYCHFMTHDFFCSWPACEGASACMMNLNCRGRQHPIYLLVCCVAVVVAFRVRTMVFH